MSRTSEKPSEKKQERSGVDESGRPAAAVERLRERFGVVRSAIESIQMALSQGSPVALWDRIGELFNPLRYSQDEMEVLDLALHPELTDVADHMTHLHQKMVKLGYEDYALGPYRTI